MSALRSSRSPADVSALIAPAQSAVTIARLPAAKSGSSAAQSALSANDPMDEQIGQASAAIGVAMAVLLASGPVATDCSGGEAYNKYATGAAAKTPSTVAVRIERTVIMCR